MCVSNSTQGHCDRIDAALPLKRRSEAGSWAPGPLTGTYSNLTLF